MVPTDPSPPAPSHKGEGEKKPTSHVGGGWGEPFAAWFAARGWTPRPHQLAMLDAARAGESVLLIAPTGGGKTLAGFLPSLVELAADPRAGLHTLYVSPLKALATDIARNLMRAGRRRWACRSPSKPAPATRPPTAAPGSATHRRTSC